MNNQDLSKQRHDLISSIKQAYELIFNFLIKHHLNVLIIQFYQHTCRFFNFTDLLYCEISFSQVCMNSKFLYANFRLPNQSKFVPMSSHLLVFIFSTHLRTLVRISC